MTNVLAAPAIKIAILCFPGADDSPVLKQAVQQAGMQAEVLQVQDAARVTLDPYQGVIIGAGNTYHNYPRPGTVAACHPVMQQLAVKVAQGMPVLGIANGAQILLEAGLVPGLENNKLAGGYYAARPASTSVDLVLRDDFQRNAFTRHFHPGQRLQLPLQCTTNTLFLPPGLLAELAVQGLDILHYAGSADAPIAALANKAGNVLAIMPQPELSPDGHLIFQSMRDYILQGWHDVVKPLDYYPRRFDIQSYVPLQTNFHVITKPRDAELQSHMLQQGLSFINLQAEVEIYDYWTFDLDATRFEEIVEREQYFLKSAIIAKRFGPGLLVTEAKNYATAAMAHPQKLYHLPKTNKIQLEQIARSNLLHNLYTQDIFYFE